MPKQWKSILMMMYWLPLDLFDAINVKLSFKWLVGSALLVVGPDRKVYKGYNKNVFTCPKQRL